MYKPVKDKRKMQTFSSTIIKVHKLSKMTSFFGKEIMHIYTFFINNQCKYKISKRDLK